METRVKSKAKGVWNMVALWIKTDTLYRTREPEIWSRYVPHPTTRHISHNQNISRAFRPASFLFLISSLNIQLFYNCLINNYL